MAHREHFTNGRCFAFASGFALVGIAFGAHIGKWEHLVVIGTCYRVGFFLMLLSAVLILKSSFSRQLETPTPQQVTTIGMPSLSRLQGINPTSNFDPKQYLARAYYSPITAEMEDIVRAAAESYSPHNKEEFYLRLIGVGSVSFDHEKTWLVIFGSQLKGMIEMAQKGTISLSDLQKHYEQAAEEHPLLYKTYTFSQWLDS